MSAVEARFVSSSFDYTANERRFRSGRKRKYMAILDPLYGTPLAVQLIPQVDRNFAEHLKLRDDQRSIGLLSVDNDDATYTAIDEATKMANVE